MNIFWPSCYQKRVVEFGEGDGRMLLREGHVPGRSSSGPENAGGDLPAQGLQDAPVAGQHVFPHPGQEGVPPMAGVWYYGYYSNVSREKRKETKEEGVPCILEVDKSLKEYWKNWARLIQKIGACPRLDRGRSIP